MVTAMATGWGMSGGVLNVALTLPWASGVSRPALSGACTGDQPQLIRAPRGQRRQVGRGEDHAARSAPERPGRGARRHRLPGEIDTRRRLAR